MSNAGIGVGGVLFVVGLIFLILQVAGVIVWPWVLVLLPWIIVGSLWVLGLLILVGAIGLAAWDDRRVK